MILELKNIIKSLNYLMKTVSKEDNILKEISYKICEVLKSEMIVLDIDGNVIYEFNNKLPSFTLKNEINNDKTLELQVVKQLENIEDIKINVTLDNLYTIRFERDCLKDIYGLFIPLYMYKEKLGNVIIYKNCAFEEDILLLCEYISSILSVFVWNNKSLKSSENQIKRQNIKTCISTLSYSELEAILCIFEEIEDGEGLVIASKIADKAGITRSVIVNALRKFESARVIETRSLGMKGTYIKVLNEYLLQELNKFRK